MKYAIEFQNLMGTLAAAQSRESGGFLSTHPNIEDRMAKVKSDLQVAERSSLPPERVARFKKVAEYW